MDWILVFVRWRIPLWFWKAAHRPWRRLPSQRSGPRYEDIPSSFWELSDKEWELIHGRRES